MATALRRLWWTDDEPVSRAKRAGVPSGSIDHSTSPPGCCNRNTNPMARSTTGHMTSSIRGSPVSRKWHHTPVAT